MQDHLYIAGIRVVEYQRIVTNATENCCLTEEDVADSTATLTEGRNYLDTQTINSRYGNAITDDLIGIIAQLEALLTVLDSL
jgi:hypothetical protein